MTEKKSYLVSDLAAELGVPRTTLNDWLKRFDRYLASEMTGRRKAYTEDALKVLREVNRMRNDGMAVSRIESELEKSFAIRPEEVCEEQKEEKAPQKKSVTLSANAPSLAVEKETETPLLPALRREEFDRFIGTLEEVSRLEKSRRRGALYVWSVIVLLALFSVMTAWYMARLVELQKAHNIRLAAIAKENAEARQVQESARIASEKALAEQKKEITSLKKDVAAARKAEADEKAKSRTALKEVGKMLQAVKAGQRTLRTELKDRYEKELGRKETEIAKLRADISKSAELRSAGEKEKAHLQRELKKLQDELAALRAKEKAASAAETKAAETAADTVKK